jgi:hypothetical protein
MTRLYAYKMTNDNGFAPNPYAGCLTLATCKPALRKTKKVGDWMAGFTGLSMGAAPGQERLVYLARISRKLALEDYYEQYPQKRPGNCPNADNIYRRDGNGSWQQLENPFHGAEKLAEDVAGKYVLVADEFYYFGRQALEIPEGVRPAIPARQHPQGFLTQGQAAEEFIAWVKTTAQARYPGQSGRLALPHAPADK